MAASHLANPVNSNAVAISQYLQINKICICLFLETGDEL
jgi:hypothetical protein